MAEKYFTVNYGKGVTVFPEKALDKIIGGEASLAEIKTLSLILSRGGSVTAEEIVSLSELSAQDVENAVAFWRGAGVITLKEGKAKAVSATKKDSASALIFTDGNKKNTDVKTDGKDETAKTPLPDGSATDRSAPDTPDTRGSATDGSAPKKALLSTEMPKYSGQEISALLDKDGGRLKSMIDECQQLIGHIFNPHETEVLVGICDWLGVDSDFVITLTAYYTRKKPGCKVGYIQRAALDLVNSGVDTIDLLDGYLKQMELYDGLAGKLRQWLGIGERAYTKKENATINHWIRDLGYGEELVKYAYDITVEHKTVFKFDYANAILENWYKDGVKDLDGAVAREEAFKKEKMSEREKPSKSSSFDTDEFFNLAVKRSYEKMSGIKNKKEQ